MKLAPRARLGPYEIVAPIGQGGMGEVYSARDTRLGRTVAVKILAAEFASDAKLKVRLEREAKAISALNHPHICTLYDVGPDYLVMEHCEGKTLAGRIAGRGLAIDQVVEYGVQIADALEKAHRAGIIHRDLKPSNIMITKSGVKLLDFGLAKQPDKSSPEDSTAQQLTDEGKILGTIQYMAPELLQGKEADARSDIFALGLVLYEMATGKPAYSGTSKANIIAAILEREPPHIDAAPPLDRLVRACLTRDPEERMQSANDVKLQLRWLAGADDPHQRTTRTWKVAALVAAVAMVGVTAAVSLGLWMRSSAEQSTYFRFEVPVATKEYHGSSLLRVSPDSGSFFTNAAGTDGIDRLYMRTSGDDRMKAITGTENVQFTWVVSTDGKLYFQSGGSLKSIRLPDGSPLDEGVKLPDSVSWGLDVNAQGLLIYDDLQTLYTVQLPGGKPAPITKLDRSKNEVFHHYPEFLPDGERYLFFARGHSLRDEETNTVWLGKIGSSDRKLIVQANSFARYVPPGYLLFARGHTLVAAPFDLRREAITGAEVPLIDDLNTVPIYGWASFTVARNGILTYRQRTDRTRLTLSDRSGNELPGLSRKATYNGVGSPSPDGQRMAVTVADENRGKAVIWIYGIAHETAARVTFEAGGQSDPVWIDNATIAYTYHLDDRHTEIRMTSVDDPGNSKTLVRNEGIGFAASYCSRSDRLIYTERLIYDRKPNEIWQIPVHSSGKAEPLVQMPFNVSGIGVSPDARWLLYASNESGQVEIYARPYGRNGKRTEIPINGNRGARWSHDGKEIILMGDEGNIYSVAAIDRGDHLEIGDRRPLFSRPGAAFDVLPDGRFILQLPYDDRNPPNIVITNWLALLKERQAKSAERAQTLF